MAKKMTFAELAAAINRMSSEVQQEVKGVTAFYLNEIEREAIRNAPGPGALVSTEYGTENERDIVAGRGWTPISQGIGIQIDPSGYKGSVFVERSVGPVAIWVEMGTGQDARRYLATVPADWRALAQKYYINGKGTILAQPYILPAFLRNRPLYIKEIKEILKNAHL